MSFAVKALNFEQKFPISFVICIEPHISNLFFKFVELQFPALSAIVMNCNFLSLLQLHWTMNFRHIFEDLFLPFNYCIEPWLICTTTITTQSIFSPDVRKMFYAQCFTVPCFLWVPPNYCQCHHSFSQIREKTEQSPSYCSLLQTHHYFVETGNWVLIVGTYLILSSPWWVGGWLDSQGLLIVNTW